MFSRNAYYNGSGAFNIILKEHVWDYSGVPLNFLGQVCVPFSLIWFALSGVAFKVIDMAQKNIGI